MKPNDLQPTANLSYFISVSTATTEDVIFEVKYAPDPDVQ